MSVNRVLNSRRPQQSFDRDDTIPTATQQYSGRYSRRTPDGTALRQRRCVSSSRIPAAATLWPAMETAARQGGALIATRTRTASDPRTRTPMGCCARTSRKVPTCHDGPPRTLKRSHWRSTTGPARHSAGARPPRCSKSSYSLFNKPVLHRPVEHAQYRSIRYIERLVEAEAVASAASKGDCWGCRPACPADARVQRPAIQSALAPGSGTERDQPCGRVSPSNGPPPVSGNPHRSTFRGGGLDGKECARQGTLSGDPRICVCGAAA